MKKILLYLLSTIFSFLALQSQTSRPDDGGAYKNFITRSINAQDSENKTLLLTSGNYQKLDSIVRWDDHKYCYLYDSEGRNSQFTYYIVDHTNYQFAPEGKYDFVYDLAGKLASANISNWDNTLMQWELAGKFESTYIENKLTSVVYYDYNNSQWINSEKTEFGYNSNNLVETEIESIWDTGISQWVFDAKYEYSYDGTNRRFLRLISVWSVNQWYNESKTTYEYDSEDNMILYVDYDWDGVDDIYVSAYKGEYTYDNLNRPLLALLSSYEPGDIWVKNRKIDYTYDYTSEPGNLILPHFRDYYYDGFIDVTTANYSMNKWNVDINEWYNTYEIFKYFSDFTYSTSLSKDDQVGLVIHPNPVHNTLYIKGLNNNSTISVLDLSGHVVINNQIGMKQIDVSHLVNGLYFLKVINNNETIIRRFIKRVN